MSCKDLEILLSAYANDELPTGEREMVNAHVTSCPDCKMLLLDFQEIRRQVSSLKDSPVIVDIKDATMAKIRSITSPTKRWLRRSFVAIPVAALLAALAIFQPWVTTPGFQVVLAKSFIATQALQSYQTELTETSPPALGLGTTTVELSYVAPDRYDIKTIIGDTVEETIKIGDTTYYQTTIQGVIPQVVNPYSSPMDPDVGSTFSLLNALHDFQTLPDQKIDGVDCYHYEGNLIWSQNDITAVDIWVGKDDNLPRKETMGSDYTVVFSNFNQPIVIAAPLTSAGDLLPGWNSLQTGPHLSVNYTDSIGGADLADSSIQYNITLYNDGLQQADNVQVTLQTMATNNSVKPAQITAVPSNNANPEDIPSWQSVTYNVTWEFDAGDLSKAELAQLIQQTTITVTYQSEDGVQITQTYPEQ
jgi:hypothetical protein